MTTYGILVFDGVQELDFVGPWEVFHGSSRCRDRADSVVLVAERPDLVRCANAVPIMPRP
jgi:putative intracellular protease/amidase